METNFLRYGVIATALAGTLCMAFTMVAQNSTPNLNPGAAAPKKWCSGCSADGKTTPRTPDGHPDFSGFYNWGEDHYAGDPTSQSGGDVLSRTPDGSIFLL